MGDDAGPQQRPDDVARAVHAGHGGHGEEEAGHGGHGGHGDGADEINYLTADELRLLAMVTGITVNIHDFEENAAELGVANDEMMEIIHEIEERLDDITRDIQSNFFAKERLDELMHEVEEHIHELEESVSDEGLVSILGDIEEGIEEFEAFELAPPEEARTRELLAIMTVVAEHVHELEEKLAELGLESDEITEILQVIEEHIHEMEGEIEAGHHDHLMEILHEIEEHVHELEESVSDHELHAILGGIEHAIEEFEAHEAEEHAGHGGHGEEEEDGHEGHGHGGHDDHAEGLHDCNWIGGGSVWTLIA